MGVFASARGNLLFQKAAENGHLNIVQFFFDGYPGNGVRSGINLNYALRTSIASLNTAMALLLLHNALFNGIDPGRYNNFAIRIAAAAGSFETVQRLLESPTFNASARHNEPIFNAAMNGHTSIFALLYNMGDSGVSANSNVFRTAADHSHVQIILSRIKLDSSPFHADSLIRASAQGYTAVVQIILNTMMRIQYSDLKTLQHLQFFKRSETRNSTVYGFS